MEDQNKNKIIRNIGILIVLIIIGVYTSGIPVPMKPPFIQFDISLENNVYYVNDTAMQRFLIVNKMPFPIKMTFTKNVTIQFVNTNTEKGAFHWQSRAGEEIRIEPFSNYELSHFGPASVELCPYTFILTVEDMQISRTIQVVVEAYA